MAIETKAAKPGKDLSELSLQLAVAGDELTRHILTIASDFELKDNPRAREFWAASRHERPNQAVGLLARAGRAALAHVEDALKTGDSGFIAARYINLGFIREQQDQFDEAANAYGTSSEKVGIVVEERRGNHRLGAGVPTLEVVSIELLHRRALCLSMAGEPSSMEENIMELYSCLLEASKGVSDNSDRHMLFGLSAELRMATYFQRINNKKAVSRHLTRVERVLAKDPELEGRLLFWPNQLMAGDNHDKAEHFGPEMGLFGPDTTI